MRCRVLVVALAWSVAVLVQANAQAPGDAPLMIRPGEISWQPAPPALEPGAEGAVLAGDPGHPGPLTIRVRLPDKYRIAPHRHAVAEYVTILSGTLCFAFGDVPAPTQGLCFGPGAFVVTPANVVHAVWASGPVEYQIQAMGPFDLTYMNPADDPRQRR